MIKRPLLLSTVIFVTGIVFKIFDVNIFYICIGIILISLIAYAAEWNMPIVLLCVIFFFSGYFRQEAVSDNQNVVRMRFDGTEEFRTMTVTDFSQGKNNVVQFISAGKNIKVYLRIEDSQALKPGDKIVAEVKLSTPSADGKFTGFGAYLSGRGIYLSGYADSVEICGHNDNIIYRIRRYMDKVGEKRFSGDVRALFNAMVFGDKHLMSDSLKNNMQKAGLNHIAAVSGMHLSVVMAAVMQLLEKTFGKRRRGNLVCIAIIIVITLLTGAGASVIRAAIMCGVYAVARTLRREPDSMTALSLAVFLMCLFNPMVVCNIGFVLSVSAVLGILLFYKGMNKRLKKLIPKFMSESISLSVSAQIMVTFPVAYYFGTFTPYSVVSNLFAMPFAGSSVVLGMLSVVLDKVPLLGDAVVLIEKLCVSALILICETVSKFPYSSIPVGMGN